MSKKADLDFFISISLNNPELNLVKYEMEQNAIILEVAIKQELSQLAQRRLGKKLRGGLSFFHKLLGKEPQLFELKFRQQEGLTFLHYFRDLSSLSEQEISLFINLLRQQYQDVLLKDDSLITHQDSLKRRVMQSLLAEINYQHKQASSISAFRQEGKIFVVNR